MRKATNYGKINLGGKDMSVAVLDDGTRILTQTGLFQAFNRSRTGLKVPGNNESNLPYFMLADNLKPHVSAVIDPGKEFAISYVGKGKDERELIGYNAEIIPHICDAFLKARDAGELTTRQASLAIISDAIVRSLAKVGIIALIDEATGYQEEREKDALNTMYKMFFAEDILPWQQRFPHLFYKELFRLNGWAWTEENMKKKPGIVGTWTNRLIYDQMPEGVREELRRRNPKSKSGAKEHRDHQLLSEDIGDPTLAKLISQALTIFGLSENMKQMWGQFERLMARRRGQESSEVDIIDVEPVEAPYQFDDKGHTIAPIEESTLSDFNKNLVTALGHKETTPS